MSSVLIGVFNPCDVSPTIVCESIDCAKRIIKNIAELDKLQLDSTDCDCSQPCKMPFDVQTDSSLDENLGAVILPTALPYFEIEQSEISTDVSRHVDETEKYQRQSETSNYQTIDKDRQSVCSQKSCGSQNFPRVPSLNSKENIDSRKLSYNNVRSASVTSQQSQKAQDNISVDNQSLLVGDIRYSEVGELPLRASRQTVIDVKYEERRRDSENSNYEQTKVRSQSAKFSHLRLGSNNTIKSLPSQPRSSQRKQVKDTFVEETKNVTVKNSCCMESQISSRFDLSSESSGQRTSQQAQSYERRSYQEVQEFPNIQNTSCEECSQTTQSFEMKKKQKVCTCKEKQLNYEDDKTVPSVSSNRRSIRCEECSQTTENIKMNDVSSKNRFVNTGIVTQDLSKHENEKEEATKALQSQSCEKCDRTNLIPKSTSYYEELAKFPVDPPEQFVRKESTATQASLRKSDRKRSRQGSVDSFFLNRQPDSEILVYEFLEEKDTQVGDTGTSSQSASIKSCPTATAETHEDTQLQQSRRSSSSHIYASSPLRRKSPTASVNSVCPLKRLRPDKLATEVDSNLTKKSFHTDETSIVSEETANRILGKGISYHEDLMIVGTVAVEGHQPEHFIIDYYEADHKEDSDACSCGSVRVPCRRGNECFGGECSRLDNGQTLSKANDSKAMLQECDIHQTPEGENCDCPLENGEPCVKDGECYGETCLVEFMRKKRNVTKKAKKLKDLMDLLDDCDIRETDEGEICDCPLEHGVPCVRSGQCYGEACLLEKALKVFKDTDTDDNTKELKNLIGEMDDCDIHQTDLGELCNCPNEHGVPCVRSGECHGELCLLEKVAKLVYNKSQRTLEKEIKALMEEMDDCNIQQTNEGDLCDCPLEHGVPCVKSGVCQGKSCLIEKVAKAMIGHNKKKLSKKLKEQIDLTEECNIRETPVGDRCDCPNENNVPCVKSGECYGQACLIEKAAKTIYKENKSKFAEKFKKLVSEMDDCDIRHTNEGDLCDCPLEHGLPCVRNGECYGKACLIEKAVKAVTKQKNMLENYKKILSEMEDCNIKLTDRGYLCDCPDENNVPCVRKGECYGESCLIQKAMKIIFGNGESKLQRLIRQKVDEEDDCKINITEKGELCDCPSHNHIPCVRSGQCYGEDCLLEKVAKVIYKQQQETPEKLKKQMDQIEDCEIHHTTKGDLCECPSENHIPCVRSGECFGDLCLLEKLGAASQNILGNKSKTKIKEGLLEEQGCDVEFDKCDCPSDNHIPCVIAGQCYGQDCLLDGQKIETEVESALGCELYETELGVQCYCPIEDGVICVQDGECAGDACLIEDDEWEKLRNAKMKCKPQCNCELRLTDDGYLCECPPEPCVSEQKSVIAVVNDRESSGKQSHKRVLGTIEEEEYKRDVQEDLKKNVAGSSNEQQKRRCKIVQTDEGELCNCTVKYKVACYKLGKCYLKTCIKKEKIAGVDSMIHDQGHSAVLTCKDPNDAPEKFEEVLRIDVNVVNVPDVLGEDELEVIIEDESSTDLEE